MPVEHLLGPLLGEKIPLDGFPQGGDVVAKFAFGRIRAVEIGACREQPLKQQARFHQIGSVVVGREGLRRSGLAVDPMREGAVIGGRPLRKEAYDPLHPFARLAARHEAAFGGHRHGHHAEARTAGSNRRARCGAFARHAARRFGTLPKITEGLPLHLGEQLLVGDLGELVARILPRTNLNHLTRDDRLAGGRFQPAVDDQPIGGV